MSLNQGVSLSYNPSGLSNFKANLWNVVVTIDRGMSSPLTTTTTVFLFRCVSGDARGHHGRAAAELDGRQGLDGVHRHDRLTQALRDRVLRAGGALLDPGTCHVWLVR